MGEEMKTIDFRLTLLSAAIAMAFPAWSQTASDDNAKKIVDGTCNACHALTARTGSGYDEKGWVTVVRMMTNLGVTIPADQVAPVTAYLAKTFPIKERATAVIVPGPLKTSMQAWQA